MLVIARVARGIVAGCVVFLLAACSSDDQATPDPSGSTGPLLDATAMRIALLQPGDVGPTWKSVAASSRPDPIVPLCAGGEDPPPVPGAPTDTVPVSLADAGADGAQTLDQVAVVYPSAVEAVAGQEVLRVSTEACARSVSVPAEVTDQRKEPAYTETLAITPLTEGSWTGFLVERHKTYDPQHAASTDTAVAVLTLRNVLLVDAYAINVLGSRSAAPNFATDWRELLESALSRVAT